MKFALLGFDEQSVALSQAAIDAGHDLIWRGDLASGDLSKGSPASPDQGDQWEDLLDRESADGIIVGRGAQSADLRLRQVQELAKLGRPMLTTFPLFDSVLSYFEVDMARTEGHGELWYFNPLRYHAEATRLAAIVDGGHPEYGRVEQVQCTRLLADRSPPNVLRHLARDADLLESLAGRIDRVGAHGGGGESAYAALAVQLLGPSNLPIRWTVEPPADRACLQLVLVCERGRIATTLDAAGEADGNRSDYARRAAAHAIEAFSEAVAQSVPAASLAGVPAWPAALHAMEIADSIEISLRRGRMIDIHSQQLTEHLAFKGIMSAAGCGVLLVVAPLMLVVGWIAGLLGVPLAAYWPHALLAMLAVFLGLQALPALLYRGDPPPGNSDRESP
jgi:hypothetical protein